MSAAPIRGRIDREGPIGVDAEVVSRRRSGPYTTLVLAAPELAARCQPGQFLEIAVEAPSTLLRRPLSIARAEAGGGGSGIGTVELVVGPDGIGSAWLADVAVGDHLDVLGPLGRPFPLPQRPAGCLLVGGGYGAAPLHYLTEVLVPLGHRVDLIVGASTEATLLHSLEAKRVAHSLVTTTDDGSAGIRGRVTDAMPDVMSRAAVDVIYACGPNAMLAAVSVLGERMGVPVRVALEERMACGLGICFTCTIPVRDRDGEVQMRRSCIDGPVMDGARVDWRLMGHDAAVDAVEAMDLPAGRTDAGEVAP
jgi:dihydroorotate dehydrogenase electron transfer subunit